MAEILWLLVAALMIVAEIMTLGLTSIWFAGGALVAALSAYLGAHWLVQMLIFAFVSLILLFCTRPFAKKHLMNKVEKTNAEGLVGETAMVTEDIDNKNSKGVVVVNGLEWTARSVDDQIIEKDNQVVIKAINGVKLIVEKK